MMRSVDYFTEDLRLGTKHVACAYCGLLFGTIIRYKDGRNTTLSQQWDHWTPQSKGGHNSDMILSCHVCNIRKKDRVFPHLEMAQEWLQQAWRDSVLTIAEYISPLLDHTQVPPKQIRSKTYEEAVRPNSVSILPPREVNVSPQSDLLFSELQSASLSREEEITRPKQRISIKPKHHPIISQDTIAKAISFIKDYPKDKLLPYPELYVNFLPHEVDYLVQLRLNGIRSSRDVKEDMGTVC